MNTPDRQQSKTLILSTNIDQKLLETELLIAICCPTGNKCQSKTLFLAIFIRVCRLLTTILIATYLLWWLDIKIINYCFLWEQKRATKNTIISHYTLFYCFQHSIMIYPYMKMKGSNITTSTLRFNKKSWNTRNLSRFEWAVSEYFAIFFFKLCHFSS